jgi:SSS family solute:Na+ symporter
VSPTGPRPEDGFAEDVPIIVEGRSVSAVVAKGNAGQIIPTYITAAMPGWFGMLFLLTLLAAAMSTLSSQFHTLGTSIGRDVYETVKGKHGEGITVTRLGIMLGVVIAVVLSWYFRGGTVIARATAIFFGLCGAAFLPAYVGGLFWKRMTRPGAIASMAVGFGTSAFWLLLVKSKEAAAIGLVQKLTDGKTSILDGAHNWPWVDPIVIALPLSILTAVVVSLLTRPMNEEHVDWCFGGPRPGESPEEYEREHTPAAPAEAD